MSPRLLAYGINSVNTVVATRFAAGLGDASVSHLYYANRLKELVLGGFAVSIATAILPLLSRQALSPDREPFKDNLAFALRLIAFVTVPATVGLVVLQVPIVRVLFEGGRFGAADTARDGGRRSRRSRLGLFFFAGVRVVVPAFYALKNTDAAGRRRARRRGRLRLALQRADAGRSVCPASASRPRRRRPSTSACCSSSLRRREGRLHGRAIARSLARIAAASAVMGALLWARGRDRPPTPRFAAGAGPALLGAGDPGARPSSTGSRPHLARRAGAGGAAAARRRDGGRAREARRPARLPRRGPRRRRDGRRRSGGDSSSSFGAETGDGPAAADEAARKVAGLRVFEDAAGKMNLALADVGGAVLAVSQFTLAADLSRGRRPGFRARAARARGRAPLRAVRRRAPCARG